MSNSVVLPGETLGGDGRDIADGSFLTAGAYLIGDSGRTKVWTGSDWVLKTVKVWTGSAWASKPAKVWTGTGWV